MNRYSPRVFIATTRGAVTVKHATPTQLSVSITTAGTR